MKLTVKFQYVDPATPADIEDMQESMPTTTSFVTTHDIKMEIEVGDPANVPIVKDYLVNRLDGTVAEDDIEFTLTP